MDEWMKWSKAHEKAIVDLGTPLGKTKRVTASGASNTKNDMTGYAIVEGDTVDSVTKMFKEHPHFKMGAGVSIEVMELVSHSGDVNRRSGALCRHHVVDVHVAGKAQRSAKRHVHDAGLVAWHQAGGAEAAASSPGVTSLS